MENKIELLAPAGNFNKLKTALYYGADAVYVGGKKFSLRAYADNFSDEELKEAVEYTHARGKKIYVTVNIFAKNNDLLEAENYFKYLESIGVDAVLITDGGLLALAKRVAPNLEIHLSTQANTTNKYTVEFWKNQGVSRVVIARELSLKEIKEITEYNKDVEIEAFVHGAMCISFSGRCLLSNYLNGRDANRGECVQACRWNYSIRERNKDGEFFDMEEDERGTYIMNSKDLNMIDHIDEMVDAGIVSFKIEGRMKGEYYLATVINAYRRAIDGYYAKGATYKENPLYKEELLKTFHRAFTKAYAFGDNKETVNYGDSQSAGNSIFTALVLDYDKENKRALIEMRNRFMKGDELEILSPYEYFNQKIMVEKLENMRGEIIEDAKLVQEKLYLYTEIPLKEGDMLRKENPKK